MWGHDLVVEEEIRELNLRPCCSQCCSHSSASPGNRGTRWEGRQPWDVVTYLPLELPAALVPAPPLSCLHLMEGLVLMQVPHASQASQREASAAAASRGDRREHVSLSVCEPLPPHRTQHEAFALQVVDGDVHDALDKRCTEESACLHRASEGRWKTGGSEGRRVVRKKREGQGVEGEKRRGGVGGWKGGGREKGAGGLVAERYSKTNQLRRWQWL